jgi:hypothetical protein
MHRKSLLLIASLVSVLASTPGAQAKDMCFEAGSGGPIKVAKGATVPLVDHCRTVTLFDIGPPWGIATGSICTSSGQGGSGIPFLLFQYTYDSCTGGSYFESATCRFALGDQTGDLPSVRDPDQKSSCKGIFAGVNPGQTGPLRPLIDTSLKAFYCNFSIPGGGGDPTACTHE